MKWPGRTVGLVALVAAAGCSSPAERAPTPAVDRLTDQLEDAWRGCCANRTLRDLLSEAT